MFIKCAFQNCGYCGNNGFCLNRLVVINEQGVCKYLTKAGWDQPVQDRFKSNYLPREPVQSGNELVLEEKIFERYNLDDICSW